MIGFALSALFKLWQSFLTALGRAKSVKLVISKIDVKQLEALAKLAEVRGVEPVL